MDFASIDHRNLRGHPAASSPPEEPSRDWKRLVLIIGLGALSWVATYVGMLELIEANMGDLPIIHKLIIAFSVAMLMTMIIWLLDQMFRPHPFLTRVMFTAGYVFLSIISVGFGFGFYWKVLESRGEASRSAESAVTQVQSALHGASTRLEQLQGTLTQLATISTEKAELERSKGTSCPNSKPGDGPRRKMREEDAQRFTFASEFVKGRVGAVNTDMAALNADLAMIASSDASTFDPKTGTRNEFMKALSRKLDMTVTGFNAFRTDPQLSQIRSDLSERADRTSFSDGKNAAVSCPDAQLQAALRGVVKAIDQLPNLTKPEIAAVEGSEATIEAFRRLTATFFGLLSFKMPPSADELRELQQRAVQSVESPGSPEVRAQRSLEEQAAGLSKRDYVPLAVAVFVDLCLLLVSMVQRQDNRINGLMPKMQAAERGPIIEILTRFNEIHRDQEIRDKFELFRHVVFDMNGDYYVAVPLDAPPRVNPAEREALRVEAQLLSNLFASFEKEKIFKRSLLPTAGSIRRRLARQGSKFAGSEAFRVYRFADGAWSDIILGAVMGAARRIEDEYRIGVRTRPPVNVAKPSITAPVLADATAEPPRLEDSPKRRRFASGLAVDPDHAARFGPYAHAFRPEPELAVPPQQPRVPRRAPRMEPEAEVSVMAKAAMGAATEHLETSTSETPDTASHGRILRLPRSPFARDTAERTPNAGREALAGMISALAALRLRGTNGAPGAPTPAPDQQDDSATQSANDAGSSENSGGLFSDDQTWTEADRALVGRMAPPAAE